MSISVSGVMNTKQVMMKIGSPAGVIAVVGPPMVMGGEKIMAIAKSRTPVKFGTLRSSGRVEHGVVGTRIIVTLGFHTDYAVYVHENLQAHHPVGQAKFLESAVQENVDYLEKSIAASIAKAMKS